MGIKKAILKDNNGNELEADFNPESLVIDHTSYGKPTILRPGEQESQDGDNQAGESGSITGYSTTLSQVTLLLDNSDNGEDVRIKTLKIFKMMVPDAKSNRSPIVTFSWGTLLFKVNITSISENLTYFSDQGVPLRASVTLTMSEATDDRSADKITSQNSGLGLSAGASLSASAGISAGASFEASAGASVSAGLSAGASIGTTPLSISQGGQSLQSMSAEAGVDWKAVAQANNIDNPRLLEAGAVVNLNVG
jgi:hypothetical protein